LEAYTFGIELEYVPDSSDQDKELDVDAIRDALMDHSSVTDAYFEWLDNKREKLNRRWDGTLSRWDDSYGPVSLDDWSSHNAEPDSTNEEEHKLWEDEQSDVDWEYRRWERNDKLDNISEFVDELIDDGEWVNYIDDGNYFLDSNNDVDIQFGVDGSIDYIQNEMNQNVVEGTDTDADTWAVGPDGDNVEIRSKHLKQTEFDLVVSICNHVRYQTTSGGTSAHVHIGLPKDFDAFDLLTITTLTDENAVKTDAGPQREFKSWSKLRNSLHNIIVNQIIKTKSNQSSATNTFVLSNSDLQTLLTGIDRFHGTNVKAMLRGTIEFRYLSSTIVKTPSIFVKWIQYFLILPKIAKSRNKVVLKSENGADSQTITAVREHGKVRFTLNGSSSMTGLPAKDIKSGEVQPTSKFADLKSKKDKEKLSSLFI